MNAFLQSFLSPVGGLAELDQYLKIFFLSCPKRASLQTLHFMYSQVSLSPFEISLRIFIALLILCSLRLTKLPKDFLALDFLTLSPNAKI